MAFFEEFSSALKQKWLQYFQANQDWLILHMQVAAVKTPDGGRRPSAYFILGAMNAIEPKLAQLMLPFSQLNPDADKLIEVLGLHFDPEMALSKGEAREIPPAAKTEQPAPAAKPPEVAAPEAKRETPAAAAKAPKSEPEEKLQPEAVETANEVFSGSAPDIAADVWGDESAAPTTEPKMGVAAKAVAAAAGVAAVGAVGAAAMSFAKEEDEPSIDIGGIDDMSPEGSEPDLGGMDDLGGDDDDPLGGMDDLGGDDDDPLGGMDDLGGDDDDPLGGLDDLGLDGESDEGDGEPDLGLLDDDMDEDESSSLLADL